MTEGEIYEGVTSRESPVQGGQQDRRAKLWMICGSKGRAARRDECASIYHPHECDLIISAYERHETVVCEIRHTLHCAVIMCRRKIRGSPNYRGHGRRIDLW